MDGQERLGCGEILFTSRGGRDLPKAIPTSESEIHRSFRGGVHSEYASSRKASRNRGRDGREHDVDEQAVWILRQCGFDRVQQGMYHLVTVIEAWLTFSQLINGSAVTWKEYVKTAETWRDLQ
jgi:hypothetical protein